MSRAGSVNAANGQYPITVLRGAGRARTRAPGAAAGHAGIAVEQERRRWARELHDETLQNLAGLLIRLSSARRRARADELSAAVDETITGLQQEITDMEEGLSTRVVGERVVGRSWGAVGAARAKVQCDRLRDQTDIRGLLRRTRCSSRLAV